MSSENSNLVQPTLSEDHDYDHHGPRLLFPEVNQNGTNQQQAQSSPEETTAALSSFTVVDNFNFEEEQMKLRDVGDNGDAYKYPPRKMTGNSVATSATAASSFMEDDDEYDGEVRPELVQPNPFLDALHEEHDELEKEGDSDEKEQTVERPQLQSCLWRWFKRVFLFLFVFGFLGFSTVMIGAKMENDAFVNKEGTAHYYQLPELCAVHDPLTDSKGITFEQKSDVRNTGMKVAHCGPCGQCSTAHDMKIMAATADSLTLDTTRCAFKIFLGRGAVEKCMEERVGFTPACQDCWLDNISCSFKSCKFTCIKHKLFRQSNNNFFDGLDDLNDCLKCDERMCGPGFIECSGSNRRRMGIVSDIERNEEDQCVLNDVDWMSLFDGSEGN